MRLKELRESQGMGQQQVADALGLPIGTYRKYENESRQPPIEILFLLADLYDVSLDNLMGRKTTPQELQKTQLVALYKLLNNEGRELLLLMAKMIVKSGDYLSI